MTTHAALAALVKEWREDNSAIHRKYTDAGVAVHKCADALAALLPALAQQEQALEDMTKWADLWRAKALELSATLSEAKGAPPR